MAPDLQTMQMLTLMGGGGGYGTDMAAQNSLPHINTTNYMQGYEERSAIRGALHPPAVHAGRIARAMSGAMGGSPAPNGMDPSSMVDPSIANSALSPYGMQLPTHTNPFLFFKDQNQDGSSTWAGNHPRTAMAVEGAMLGAANTGQGQTIGENISNVARSVMSIPGAYRQNQSAQMQAPFDMAHQISGLQDEQTNRDYKLAETFHAYATGKALLDKPPKQFGTQVYGDEQGHYVIDQGTGRKKYVDDTPDQNPGTTKVGGPVKPGNGPGLYPKGITAQPQKQAYDEYRNRGDFDAQHLPNDWNHLVNKYISSQATLTGGGHTSGAKNVGQSDYGDVPQTTREQLDALKQSATSTASRAKEALKASDYATASDPLAARNADRQQRENDAKAAEQKYQDAVAALPSSKTSKSPTSSRPKTTIHPDGRIEVQ